MNREGRVKKSSTTSPSRGRRTSSEGIDKILMKERIRAVNVSRATMSLTNLLAAGSRSIHVKNTTRCAKKS